MQNGYPVVYRRWIARPERHDAGFLCGRVRCVAACIFAQRNGEGRAINGSRDLRERDAGECLAELPGRCSLAYSFFEGASRAPPGVAALFSLPSTATGPFVEMAFRRRTWPSGISALADLADRAERLRTQSRTQTSLQALLDQGSADGLQKS